MEEMAEDTKYDLIKIPDTKTELNLYLSKKAAMTGLKTFKANSSQKEHYENHPGIRSAFTALNMNRSPNTAFMYLLGVTGSGKSSTVNFLFDKEISQTGSEKSITIDTIENTSLIKDSRLFIENLSISIIDGPGLEDTSGNQVDTKNILCHLKFIESHPQLRNVKPNVVMIVLNITDNRLGGDKNTNTPFARMLKAVKEFLGPKLIDYKNPNVIFVLTNFHRLTKREVTHLLPDRIKSIKFLSAKCLGVTDPDVVVTENCPEDYDDLKKNEHGWYTLRNGEKHPLTLFSQLIQLCKKTNDHIGQEAISKYFSQDKKASKIVKGHSVKQDSVEIDKNFHKIETELRNIKLDATDTPLLSTLEKEFRRLPEQQQKYLGELTPINVESFLKDKNITSINNLPQDEKFLELFASYPKHSSELLSFLQNALSIKLSRNKIDTKIGCCFNVINDSVLGNSVFELSGRYQLTWAGFQIPEEVDIYEENSTFARSEQFSNVKEYMNKRLAELGINADISFIDTKVKIRNGYSVSNDSSSNYSEKTILLERHIFRLTMNEDKLQLTQKFKDDIHMLPDLYDKENEDNVNRWKMFFNKYGTHVLKTAWGGGACVATAKLGSNKCTQQDVHELMIQIESRLAGTDIDIKYEDKTERKTENLFNTSSIHMEGGDPSYHVTNLKSLNSENVNKWLASIFHKPVILTTKLELIPINQLVGGYRPEIIDVFSRVYSDHFGANLKYVPLRERTSIPEEMTAIDRKDATEKSAPDTKTGANCIVGGTLILLSNGKEIPVEHIKQGDLVMDKDGKCKKVIGKNISLLGNRFLYGFQPYSKPFFTSEHLFITDNDQWACVDPNELKSIDPQTNEKIIQQLNSYSRIMKYNEFGSEIVYVNIYSTNKMDPKTKVYCLIVEGATYIANGFITKDDCPDLLAWPSFAICTAILLSSLSVKQLHETLESVEIEEKLNIVEVLSLQISIEWNEILVKGFGSESSNMNENAAVFNWMEKLTNVSNLSLDEHSFIADILNRPSLTYLAQRLYMNCGENIESSLGQILFNDKMKFVRLTSRLCSIGESIISNYLQYSINTFCN